MKEKQFVDLTESNESLEDLYEQYVTYTKMESDLKKKKAVIKEKLSKFFDSDGNSDDFGNVWCILLVCRVSPSYLWRNDTIYGGYGAIMKFYGELDGSNRNLMLNYIIDNYNDEQRIPLNEEMLERD